MKTKNLIVEIICDPKGKRYYIVREIVPNSAPVTVHVTDSSSDLSDFLAYVRMD